MLPPNAPVRPGDGGGHPQGDELRAAQERMRAATVAQLRTALVMHARGEDVGVFAQYIKPFLKLEAA